MLFLPGDKAKSWHLSGNHLFNSALNTLLTKFFAIVVPAEVTMSYLLIKLVTFSIAC